MGIFRGSLFVYLFICAFRGEIARSEEPPFIISPDLDTFIETCSPVFFFLYPAINMWWHQDIITTEYFEG